MNRDIVPAGYGAASVSPSLPRSFFSGPWKYGHCQGIALDVEKGHMYYSFTTALVKTDMSGKFIGSVVGLLGHLGCIDFCSENGRVYGSLEYKNDAIGKGILKNIGSDAKLQDAFYMVWFDVDKIDRPDMDAGKDGVMHSVYLKEVVDDYSAKVECDGKTVDHRHGCSGIDGCTFGPIPGSNDPKQYLFVTYGIYSDLERTDNDHQVILCYDTSEWDSMAQPLNQQAMHTSGPAAPDHKYFVYTGNTDWGMQNLEYDPFTGNFLMAVYVGKKPGFPNNPLYIVDGSKPAVTDEQGREILTLLQAGIPHESGVFSWTFPLGSIGVHAMGDGTFYVADREITAEGESALIRLYKWDNEQALVLAK